MIANYGSHYRNIMTEVAFPNTEEIPMRCQHVQEVNNETTRRSSRAIVDWTLLLDLNPPPGYNVRRESEASINNAGDNTQASDNDIDGADDKVVIILQNILRHLEKEIRDDKKRLKDERRLKREQRRRDRQERLHSTMAVNSHGNRRTFPTVQFSPFPGNAPTSRGTYDKINIPVFGVLKDVKTSSIKRSLFSKIRTQSLDRNISKEKVTNSQDWSRYACDPDLTSDTDLDVVCENSPDVLVATHEEGNVNDFTNGRNNGSQTLYHPIKRHSSFHSFANFHETNDRQNLQMDIPKCQWNQKGHPFLEKIKDKLFQESSRGHTSKSSNSTSKSKEHDTTMNKPLKISNERDDNRNTYQRRRIFRKQLSDFDILPTYKKNKNENRYINSDGNIESTDRVLKRAQSDPNVLDTVGTNTNINTDEYYLKDDFEADKTDKVRSDGSLENVHHDLYHINLKDNSHLNDVVVEFHLGEEESTTEKDYMFTGIPNHDNTARKKCTELKRQKSVELATKARFLSQTDRSNSERRASVTDSEDDHNTTIGGKSSKQRKVQLRSKSESDCDHVTVENKMFGTEYKNDTNVNLENNKENVKFSINLNDACATRDNDVEAASNPKACASRADDEITSRDVNSSRGRYRRKATAAKFRKSLARLDGECHVDTERSQSTGTSGYSTDELSNKSQSSDSDDDGAVRYTTRCQKGDNKYFLVLQNCSKMALKVDDSRIPDQENMTQRAHPLLKSVSMSDLAIPDHVGWLIDQSEQRTVWGVVVDMLFCVFETGESQKPEEVILLPGCSVRPLVYKTAMSGINGNKSNTTISGIGKFQFVIDNSSTGKKHIFSVESQTELDTWYNVLKRASTLDADSTNDISTCGRRGSLQNEKRLSLDLSNTSKTGYKPSQYSPNRVQKMSNSPLSSPRDNGTTDELNDSTEDAAGSVYNGNVRQPSPRGHGLVRNDSRRQSVQDFKKRLRREIPEPEVSKQMPIKAQHFQTNSTETETKVHPDKKLKKIGSFENLFKRRKKKSKEADDSISNDDSASIVSGSSLEPEMASTSQSLDISATKSTLKKTKSKQLSKSLDFSQPKNASSLGLVRRASDIKDRVFPRRASRPTAKLGDLTDVTINGFLHHKYHLKWHRLWCAVCRGCFYGFKSQAADECAQVSVVLSSCAVVYVAERDKRQKRMYIFKLSQENKRSIYLCAGDYKEFQQWLTVLQMESNSVVANAHKIRTPSESENDSICSSLSSQNGSIVTVPVAPETETRETSRSRSKKQKRAPVKPPRHSSCPPSVSRDKSSSERGSSVSSAAEDVGNSGNLSSQSEDQSHYGSSDTIPKHDKTLTHVWQNDRGYLFNVIKSKLKSYRQGKDDIYNRDTPGVNNEGLLLLQDGAQTQGSKEIRRVRSFNTQTGNVIDVEKRQTATPTESPTYLRKRHKPLAVKKIPAKELEDKQSIAGYMEKKSFSVQWIKYWYILHEGTLFCYLTSDDSVTVDVLNLHGYTVTCLVDKFRGKRFVLQLTHEHFTSLCLSMESREEMDQWLQCLQHAKEQPSSDVIEEDNVTDEGACAGCENNRKDDVGEKRKEVKQKLLEEMLRQKHELERKQARRQKKQQNKDSPDSPDRSASLPDFTSDDQRTSNVTRLRQRRLSTQLKFETIQKQIEKPANNKRGLFSFGKAKKLDENKNEFLEDQLKELNVKLHKIDTDLNIVNQEKLYSSAFDVSQNTNSLSSTLPADLNLLDRSNDSEDDVMGRGNSIKATMQKWTNKTFSKSSTKKKNTSTSGSKLSQNGSVPNLSSKQNGDINANGINGYGHNYDAFEGNVNNEDFTSFENSVTDLTRPTSDLKLDLNVTHNGLNGSNSPTSQRYGRSNSRNSLVSSLSSPRREIDPSVLAEIDAFEELTKQVLNARLPAK